MRLVLILTLLMSSAAFANKAGPIKQDYPLEKIADEVYIVHGPLGLPDPENQGFMNNPGFLITSAGVVVVDPGSTVQVGDFTLAKIKSVTDKPVVAVFNTHIHGDHWLGNQAIKAAYPDAKIYAHANLLSKIADGTGEYWVDLMLEMTKGASAGTKVVGATIAVDEGDVITVGDVTFRIMHPEPGLAHTDTDIMVFAEQRSIVFLGDNAGYERILRNDHGGFDGNVKALNAAIATGAKVFVPGHGISGGVNRASEYRDYLTTLYTSVKKYYEEDLSDFEMKPKVVSELVRWHKWNGFDEEIGKHINGVFLEIESADF